MKKLFVFSATALVVLALVAAFAVAFYIDGIVKKSIEKVGPMVTKTSVTLDAVNLSLLSGEGRIKGFTIANPAGYKSPAAIKVGDALMELSPGSVFKDKVVIRKINVRSPQIVYETDFKGSNLAKLLANIEEATGTAEKQDSGPGRKMQVDEFVISDARVSVALTQLGGRTISVPIPDIHIKDLGQGPDGITAADLARRVIASVESSAVAAAGKAAGDFGENAAGLAKDAASSASDALKKGVGGFLKRK